MDFWIIAGSTRLLLPVPPPQVTVETGARMITVETIRLGELAWPRGTKVRRISWEGLLPGEARKNLPGIKQWQPPRQILARLSQWRNDGTKVRVLVTETTINMDAYIENLQQTWRGGHGDCWYQIQFAEARVVQAVTVGGTTAPAAAKGSKRPAPPKPKTYTVKPGDSLWTIAQRLLGSGSRWKELYELNRKVIGPDPDRIRPGQVLRLPAA